MNPAFGGFYQIAYITTDLARAIGIFRDRYGIPSFLEIDSDMPAKYRGAPDRLNLRLALVNLNGVQIELIQPYEGCMELYREGLPTDGFGIRHHHVAVLVEGDRQRWNEWRSAVEQDGTREVALEMTINDDINVIYMDDRSSLGHYTEYYWSEGPNQLMAAIPTFNQTT